MSEPLLLDIDSAEGGGGGERGNKGRTTGENGGKQHEIDRGLAVVELSTLHFYLVSGYHGDCNHDYVCAYVSTYMCNLHLHMPLLLCLTCPYIVNDIISSAIG